MSQDTVHAVVTRKRGINRNHIHVPQDGIIEDMALDQFSEWNRLNIVERATPEQVAAHREAVAQAEAQARAKDAEREITDSAPRTAAKKPTKSKKSSSSRPSRPKKAEPEAPAVAASPLTAPVLGTVTTETEATEASA